MSTPEGKVKDRVKEILQVFGAYYVMPATGGFGRSGVPDFIVCYRGVFIGIETKAGGGQPTALQKRELARIEEAGGESLVIDENNLHELEDLLRAIYTEVEIKYFRAH